MHAWPLHALMHRVFVVKWIVLLNSSFHQISKNFFSFKVLIPLCLCPHIGMLIDDLIIFENDDLAWWCSFCVSKSCFLMRLMILLSCMKAFVWFLVVCFMLSMRIVYTKWSEYFFAPLLFFLVLDLSWVCSIKNDRWKGICPWWTVCLDQFWWLGMFGVVWCKGGKGGFNVFDDNYDDFKDSILIFIFCLGHKAF